VKLIQVERESVQLADEVRRWPSHLTSVIGDVEFRRAAVRWKVEPARLEDVLAHLVLIELDEPIRLLAGRVGSSQLRSLDAIHLATALSLGDDLGAFCCYDLRLRADAKDAGLTVLSPGLD
jgi:uncharacterized protein